jgi:hypothetical protein
MNEVKYDNDSNDPSMWTSDKQMAEMNKPGSGSKFQVSTETPGFFLGPWGGVIGLGAIGFFGGLLFGGGSLVAAFVGATVFALPAYLFKLAFSTTYNRPRVVKFAATSAIVGVLLALIIDVTTGSSTSLALSALLGATIGAVVSLFRRTRARR